MDEINALVNKEKEDIKNGVYHTFTRNMLFLTNDMPTLRYRQYESIEKLSIGWGQLKLMLTEITFLVHYLSKDIVDPVVLYIGAAPGHHIKLLAEMFPQVKEWHLWDGAEFGIKTEGKITIHNKLFYDEDTEVYKAMSNRLILISDIRYGAPGKEKETEERVKVDMKLQQGWVEMIKPAVSSLKFRLSYVNIHTTRYFEYLDGIVILQPFRGNTSTEGRLIVKPSIKIDSNTREEVKTFEYKNWDVLEYEQKLFYNNLTIRNYRRFYTPYTNYKSIPDNKGLINDHDGTMCIEILCLYLDFIGWSSSNETEELKNQDKFITALALSTAIRHDISSYSNTTKNLNTIRNFITTRRHVIGTIGNTDDVIESIDEENIE